MTCTIFGFESLWTLLGTSQTALGTNLRHLQDVSKNCGSIDVQCIPIEMSMIAWCFMRARNEVVLRVGTIGPITEEFLGNLNKTKYLHVIFIWFVTYFLIINLIWNFAYMCTSLCNITFKFEIWKEHVNCLWLFVEDESIHIVLSFVRNCIL
jgi:hypothetical protein